MREDLWTPSANRMQRYEYFANLQNVRPLFSTIKRYNSPLVQIWNDHNLTDYFFFNCS